MGLTFSSIKVKKSLTQQTFMTESYVHTFICMGSVLNNVCEIEVCMAPSLQNFIRFFVSN